MTFENKASLNKAMYSSSFLNSRGKKMFCKYWEPDRLPPRALVFISHGMAEHCLVYEKLAKLLVANGFLVFAHDHIGHGQSSGARAHVEKFQHYVDDVIQHIQMMKGKHLGVPVFLCGHSMGGTISILAAMRKPDEFKGVILIAPAVLANPETATSFKVAASRILRVLTPHFPVARLDITKACSCPVAVTEMQQDPLRYHGYITAGLGAGMIEALKEIQDELQTINFPFLLLQGDEDKLCDPKGADAMYEKAMSKDKAIKIYPRAYHALLVEPNGVGEQVMEDITEWLTMRS